VLVAVCWSCRKVLDVASASNCIAERGRV
jgi:hypothetical protein